MIVMARAKVSAPVSAPAKSQFPLPTPKPVHSAHVGDEVEVYYRWHPYFGQRVSIWHDDDAVRDVVLTIHWKGGQLRSSRSVSLRPVNTVVPPLRMPWR